MLIIRNIVLFFSFMIIMEGLIILLTNKLQIQKIEKLEKKKKEKKEKSLEKKQAEATGSPQQSARSPLLQKASYSHAHFLHRFCRAKVLNQPPLPSSLPCLSSAVPPHFPVTAISSPHSPPILFPFSVQHCFFLHLFWRFLGGAFHFWSDFIWVCVAFHFEVVVQLGFVCGWKKMQRKWEKREGMVWFWVKICWEIHGLWLHFESVFCIGIVVEVVWAIGCLMFSSFVEITCWISILFVLEFSWIWWMMNGLCGFCFLSFNLEMGLFGL